MKVLIVLLGVFAIATVVARLYTGDWNLVFSGNLAMCLMLCFTAAGHFKFSQGMMMMIPGFIPFKQQIVFLSGITEIMLGAALLMPAARPVAGVILILLFLLLLPANIYAAYRHIHLEKASLNGPGLAYLLFRVPLQLFFIGWVWFFAVRK